VGARWRPLKSRYRAVRDLIREIDQDEKVLVFSEARETLAMLATQLERDGFHCAQYHGDLPTVERDRQVARFRDPEGPRVLLCTELGGEGRNFQHCHVLVNHDLAWSPAAIEQRIGRIDRIGQSREVSIYAFRPEGTLAARVLDVLRSLRVPAHWTEMVERVVEMDAGDRGQLFGESLPIGLRLLG